MAARPTRRAAKTAVFRLLDLIGLDVMAHVNTNLAEALGDESADILRNPAVTG